MTTNENDKSPTLDDNPGLEHDETTPEGELMTAAGSKISDPRGHDADVTLDDHPGLEHDEATEPGRKMTGSGSTDPGEKDPG